jgi:hypothetical protein
MLMKCGICNGTGWIKCPQCAKIKPGKIKGSELCPQCQGKKQIRCPGCGGAGFVETTAFA